MGNKAYVVNTNLRFDLEYAHEHNCPLTYSYRTMLSKARAYAFGDRRNRLNSIEPGHFVFLYHNRVGICAMGRAKSVAKAGRPDYRGEPTKYVPLSDFLYLDPIARPEYCLYLTAIAIALGRPAFFPWTCVSLNHGRNEGEKLWAAFERSAPNARTRR